MPYPEASNSHQQLHIPSSSSAQTKQPVPSRYRRKQQSDKSEEKIEVNPQMHRFDGTFAITVHPTTDLVTEPEAPEGQPGELDWRALKNAFAARSRGGKISRGERRVQSAEQACSAAVRGRKSAA